MAYLVKHGCKVQRPEFIPQFPHKKPYTTVYPCNPHAGEEEQEDPYVLLAVSADKSAKSMRAFQKVRQSAMMIISDIKFSPSHMKTLGETDS